MKRTIVGLVVALTVSSPLALESSASADPTGTSFDVYLDASVISPSPPFGALEGHFGTVIFDGLPNLILNDFDPGPPPPFENGNDLIVTEGRVENPDDSETISIWMDAQVPGQPFPTPGARLFANTLDPTLDVFFGIGDSPGTGLHWNDESKTAIVSNVEFTVTFPFPKLVIPIDGKITGIGTPSDPLFFFYAFDSADFYFPAGDTDGLPATDFHLTFTVTHVPEPTTFSLAVVGMLLVAGRRKGRLSLA